MIPEAGLWYLGLASTMHRRPDTLMLGLQRVGKLVGVPVRGRQKTA